MPVIDLLDLVVAGGYAGRPWEELLRRLVPYALHDLARSIASGTIHGRWAAIGYSVPRSDVLRRPPVPDEIALEAVENTIPDLKGEILPRGLWNPAGKVTLESFFVGCCLPAAANAYRKPIRRLSHEGLRIDVSPASTEMIIPWPRTGAPDPAETMTRREQVQELLESSTHRDGVALVLEAEGWSRAEIAEQLGVSLDAVRARLSRARRKLAQLNGGE
jgi:DNA-binding CsgD family transcriptional regulator